MLLPLYARHKTRDRQERNTESNTGNCCLCTQGNLRKEALNCNERAIGGEEEGKRYLTLGCFVEDVLLSFCVDQDGPGVGLACLDQCKTGGNNREDEVEKSKIKNQNQPSFQARKSGGDETSTRAGDAL